LLSNSQGGLWEVGSNWYLGYPPNGTDGKKSFRNIMIFAVVISLAGSYIIDARGSGTTGCNSLSICKCSRANILIIDSFQCDYIG
jgi:hypothetical protein